MTEITTEAELAATAHALAGGSARYSFPERCLIVGGGKSDPATVTSVKALAAAGADPLGEIFCQLRSGVERRRLGAVYTPKAVVDSMMLWAARQGDPERIVDPGCGSGRFILAAAARFPKAELVAVDIDPLAVLILRANAQVRCINDRLRVHCGDYRHLSLPVIKGKTLFIGNPPYVRHHDLAEAAKTWLDETAARLGFKASKLAGLHVHFFVKTHDLARRGDFGTFITSSEWLDVNYGSILRKMLGDGLGGCALHVLSPESRPFADAATTGVITCFRVGNRPRRMALKRVKSLAELGDLSGGNEVCWKTLSEAPRWSIIVRPGTRSDPNHIELGDLFRVHRGQVTGNNRVWIAGPNSDELPQSVLYPTVTRGKELIRAGPELGDAGMLRRVIDLPADLDRVPAEQRHFVDRFLGWAAAQGGKEGYIASRRRAWWSVNLRPAAPILCSYMARRPPAFVWNGCRARHINIAHGLYPIEPLSEAALKGFVRFLNGNVSIDQGRTYAGGLTKFEPREIEGLYIPRPEALDANF